MNNNYYSILGIPNFSDIEVVKKAFRELSKKYHPDNYGDISEDDRRLNLEKQQELNNIYSILSNKEKKEEYDNKLRRFSSNNTENIFNGNFHDFYEKDIDPYENSSFSFTFDEELKSFFYYEQQEFINKQNLIKQQAVLKNQLSMRELIVRMSCTSAVANMRTELSSIDLSIKDINEFINDVRQKKREKSNQLVALRNKKLYQLMPSRYKVVEDILVKEIENLETELTLLETKLSLKQEEFNKLNGEIIYYERNAIENDSEVIRLRNEIKNIELELEKLNRKSKV